MECDPGIEQFPLVGLCLGICVCGYLWFVPFTSQDLLYAAVVESGNHLIAPIDVVLIAVQLWYSCYSGFDETVGSQCGMEFGIVRRFSGQCARWHHGSGKGGDVVTWSLS